MLRYLQYRYGEFNYEIMSSNENVGDIISNIVIDKYNRLPSNGKPRANEYTVLASIVAQISPNEYVVVSLATGTKCISNKSDEYHAGITIADSHAEVLARKCFCRFVLECVKEILSHQEFEMNSLCPLTSVNGKFIWKTNLKYYLYISDSPCGECSIYQRCDELSFTGKKSFSVAPVDSTNTVCLLRTKPGRLDIPPNLRSCSMSCSDKIARWGLLGIQGYVL